MNVLYGLKVKNEDDIFDGIGKPQNIVSFARENSELIFSKLGEAFRTVKEICTVHVSDIEFKFVPLFLVEELILHQGIISSMSDSSDRVATSISKIKTMEIANSAERRLEDEVEKYLDNLSIDCMDILCLFFIFNRSGGIKDIGITKPKLIMERLDAVTSYSCHHCKKVEIAERDDLPEHTKYCIKNGKVFYYCEKCAKSTHIKTADLGDIFR